MLSLSSRPAVVSAEDSKPFEESFSVVQEKIKSSEVMKVNLSMFLKSPKYLVRKTAHVILYCGLYMLTVLAFMREKNRMKQYIMILIGCVLYACFDEFYQTFIPGRTGLLQDVLIDSIGIVIGLVLSSLIVEIGKAKKTKYAHFLLNH
jgi:VanZ family protein